MVKKSKPGKGEGQLSFGTDKDGQRTDCAPRSQSAIFRSGLVGLGSSAPLTQRGKVRKSKRLQTRLVASSPEAKAGFCQRTPYRQTDPAYVVIFCATGTQRSVLMLFSNPHHVGFSTSVGLH